jgi:peptidoglycan hydrolase-like protein with peptidoglycan-binding domain
VARAEPVPQQAAAINAVQPPVKPLHDGVADQGLQTGALATAQPKQKPLTGPEPSQLMRDLQILMGARGLYRGEIDGLPSPGTSDAIKSLERSLGLVQTGEPSERLLAIAREKTLAVPLAPKPAAPEAVAVPAPAAPAPVPEKRAVPAAQAAPVPPMPIGKTAVPVVQPQGKVAIPVVARPQPQAAAQPVAAPAAMAKPVAVAKPVPTAPKPVAHAVPAGQAPVAQAQAVPLAKRADAGSIDALIGSAR